jgi:uncharacterized membrane protein SpoIIM required for sporulation
VIIDLEKFISEERPFWTELEQCVRGLEDEPDRRMDLTAVKRFHYLYQRASSDLSRIKTFSTEPEIRRYLESLISRAFSEIHETREKTRRFRPVRWFFRAFPRTFRRHIAAFSLSAAIMLLGALFGGAVVGLDPGSKEILMPFSHLEGDPSKRVAMEESAKENRIDDHKAQFSSYLITHNTRVSIFTLSLGMTWGVGTVILLFANGVMLGAVALDYLLAGEGVFLVGWLLPHGSIEIPAILIAGQAGLMLGGALIGWGRPVSLAARLRIMSKDLVTLIGGVAVLLIWAGAIEGFLSQYHEPTIPYGAKIGFGTMELVLLILFLWKSGAGTGTSRNKA